MTSTATGSVGAANAGLEILVKANAVISELERECELSVQQIAQLVEEPVSSTYRLLQSLILVDWIEPSTRRGMYRLGVYFMRVGGRYEDRIDVRREALEPLRALQVSSGWAASLFVRRGLRAVCVERFDGSSVRSTALQIGDSLPLDVGAGPLALLAFLPTGEQRGVLRQLLTAPDGHRRADLSEDDLRALLADVHQRGSARSDGQVTPGIAALAAPVFNHRGELVASVEVSGLSAPLLTHEEQLTSAVCETAAVVSRLLGDERI